MFSSHNLWYHRQQWTLGWCIHVQMTVKCCSFKEYSCRLLPCTNRWSDVHTGRMEESAHIKLYHNQKGGRGGGGGTKPVTSNTCCQGFITQQQPVPLTSNLQQQTQALRQYTTMHDCSPNHRHHLQIQIRHPNIQTATWSQASGKLHDWMCIKLLFHIPLGIVFTVMRYTSKALFTCLTCTWCSKTQTCCTLKQSWPVHEQYITISLSSLLFFLSFHTCPNLSPVWKKTKEKKVLNWFSCNLYLSISGPKP